MSTEPEKTGRWIRVDTGIFDHPMLAGEYDRRSAWLWLIANAAWKDHTVRTRGGMVELKRGEVLAAREHLADVWGWTQKRCRYWLGKLLDDGCLEKVQRNGQYANVYKISNYERFQSPMASDGPPKGPTKGQRRANEGPYSTKDTKDTKVVGEAADDVCEVAAPKHPTLRAVCTLSARDRKLAEAAIGDFNTAADTIGFSRCAAITTPRLAAVGKRLADLGSGDLAIGGSRFQDALSAIPHWPFLAGREKPREGRRPFRLDLDRLLSTGSGMGDVLAKLLDLHAEHGPAPTTKLAEDRRADRQAFADMWREARETELAEQRARWNGHASSDGGTDAVH